MCATPTMGGRSCARPGKAATAINAINGTRQRMKPAVSPFAVSRHPRSAIRARIRRKENVMSRLRCAVLLAAAALPLCAQKPPAADSAAPAAAEENAAPIPSETTSATGHELQLDGKAIHYQATAGTLLIDGD